MRKSELKKMLKPIVEECIRETLYESGLLSSIISEVVQGVTAGQRLIREQQPQQPVAESRQRQEPVVDQRRVEREKKAELRKTKKNLLDSIGKEAYNGIDLFEGTTPLRNGGNPSGGASSQGPFNGVDPGDPGVNIDSLTESLGGVWKKLAEGGKK